MAAQSVTTKPVEAQLALEEVGDERLVAVHRLRRSSSSTRP